MMQALTFEDIATLDEISSQRLLRAISDEDVACALKGASPLTQAHIFKHLPLDRADRVRQALHETGPLPVARVEEAQARTVDAFKRLMDTGEIIFA